MELTREEKALFPRMVVFITSLEDERRLDGILTQRYVPVLFQCRGKGTATSEMLDIFGLSGSARLVTVSVQPRFLVKPLFAAAGRLLPLRRRGGGVAFTIPLTGIQHPLLQLLNEEARRTAAEVIEQRREADMAEIQEKSKYTLIWVAVASGHCDEVVDAARAAGARGGTILKGQRRSSEETSRHFGLALQEGQEFVMIVVPRAKKGAVMAAINTACGLKTPAHGVLLSLPVDEVMGLADLELMEDAPVFDK